MTLLDIDQLVAAIDAAVHTNGPLGKTTAAGLNALLKSVASGLVAQQQSIALDLSGKADLDAGGHVPSSQLPSPVRTVQEAATLQALPRAGEAGILYLVLDTNSIYHWAGSGYAALAEPVSAATRLLLAGKQDRGEKGTANGYAGLDDTGKVPAAQLPSYVDDVLEAASFAALPSPGEGGKIYLVLDTNAEYRWSGSQYVEIGKSPLLYATTGQNTDGGMTQKAVTSALGGVADLTANKAILVKADRSKLFYTGAGTLAAVPRNSDDAIVRVFKDSQPGDYVYITAPVVMPNAGTGDQICNVKGGTFVNLSGYSITSDVRRDALGIVGPGAGDIYGGGGVVHSTSATGGSTCIWTSPSDPADYRLLDITFKTSRFGNGLYLTSGNYFHTGVLDIDGLGRNYGVHMEGVSTYELVGDLTAKGNVEAINCYGNNKVKIRNGQVKLTTANCKLGNLYNASAVELENVVVTMAPHPAGGGFTVSSPNVAITLTDCTVIGGEIVNGNCAATLVLRGATTLPLGYGVDYYAAKGMRVADERPPLPAASGGVAVAHRTSSALTFEQNAEYDPVLSGTFTVDAATKRIGAVVVVYLGPAAAAPSIPATGFQSKDAYVAGKNLMYTFKVGANGSIQYTITVLD